jgi:hypothetical protein
MRVPFTSFGRTTHPEGFPQEERIDDDSTDPAIPSDSVTDSVTDNDAVHGEALSKGLSHDDIKDYNRDDRHLDVRPISTLRPSADSLFSDLSLYGGNLSNSHAYRSTLRSPSPAGPSLEPIIPPPRRKLRTMLRTAWLHSKGMFMVILSQFFGASMNVMTQMLEKDGSHGKAMHPFQVSGMTDS